MKIIFLISTLFSLQPISAQSTFVIEGHRGCRGLYPENTIVAFKHAVKMGADMLEMDVQVTKDGRLIISHDPYLNPAICNTPSGTPVTAATKKQFAIYHMNYSEVAQCDCGSRGNPRFPQQHKIAAYKPLVRDVIDSVQAYILRNHLPQVRYNIEIKSARSSDGRLHPKPDIIAAQLYQLLHDKGVLPHCIIQSFDVRGLQFIHQKDSSVQIGLLVLNARSMKGNLKHLGFKPDYYSPAYILLSKRLIKKCHANKLRIGPWTVDKDRKMVRLKKMGADGLITDYPNRAIQLLR